MSRWTVSVSSGDDTLVVGQLFTHQRRERMSSSFRYEPGWLAAPQAYALEPAMSLSAGDYAVSRGLPRSIRDAAPDRWGRNLIEKRLRAQWAAAGDFPRRVTELDYLLGVSDHTRQGALRFSLADGPFLAEGQEIPKLVALPKLLAASRRVAMNNLSGDAGGAVIQTDGAAAMAAVKTLLDAGTASLGGARPKAALEIDGHLFIAKFPHPADRWDVMRWEHLALELAEMAGITVPAHQLVEVEGSAVLLSRRFDRDERGGRIGYISAMTMLEADEGSSSDYLDIADSLTELSIAASEDLSQLYRRILFSAFIHNTDDHLRNHGLVRHNAGWRLSPAFGLNPNPDLTRRHVTTIGGVNGDMTAEVQALSHAREWFGLTEADARTISAEVAAALTQWRTQAQLSGITAGEIQLFAPVFNAGHKALK